ncbi:thioredoxin family protein [Pirellulaceae bacterium]|nr:thioredoxin family protein [Pirellulaceae bacterium]
MIRRLRFLWIVSLLTIPIAQLTAQTRDEQVINDRDQLADDNSWYYDDLDAAISVAAKQDKPIMVVLRCIP